MISDSSVDSAARPRSDTLAEMAIPIGLATWRLTWYEPATLWRDWVLLVSLYWVFTIYARRSKAWAPVTIILSIALFSIYLSRQYDHIVGTLRFAW